MNPDSAAARDQGVSIGLPELLHLRREALGPGGKPADLVGSLFPGAYRARSHGRGIEFDETREYHRGDDYRSLDWRVTARTGRMHTKLFHEEREHTLYLVVDAGPSMQFGSQIRYKWVQAARAAALMAWLAMNNGDRVAALVFGDGPRPHYCPPGAGETGVMRLLRLLAGLRLEPGEHEAGLEEALHLLRRRTRPGSLILLISDFAGLDDPIRRHIAHLARHAEIAAIQVYDPLEADLPPPGLYPVSDGNEQALLDSADPTSRLAYAREFQTRQERLRRELRGFAAPLLTLGTHQATAQTLQTALRPSRRVLS